jgi:hypothetical protein
VLSLQGPRLWEEEPSTCWEAVGCFEVQLRVNSRGRRPRQRELGLSPKVDMLTASAHLGSGPEVDVEPSAHHLVRSFQVVPGIATSDYHTKEMSPFAKQIEHCADGALVESLGNARSTCQTE